MIDINLIPITLDRGCRNRWYFVITMPIGVKSGHGPVDSTRRRAKLTWEVWNQVCETFGSFDYLPDAIDHAEKLNEEHYQWEHKDD